MTKEIVSIIFIIGYILLIYTERDNRGFFFWVGIFGLIASIHNPMFLVEFYNIT